MRVDPGRKINVHQAMARLTSREYGRPTCATGSSFDLGMTCGVVPQAALSATDHQSVQMGGSVDK